MFYSPISFTYCQFKIILLWGPRGSQHFFVRLCSSLTFLCGTCDVNQGARVVKALTEKWLRWDKTLFQTISSQVSPWLKICLHRTWHLLAPLAKKQGWCSSEDDNSTGKGRTIIHLWFLWQPYSCFVRAKERQGRDFAFSNASRHPCWRRRQEATHHSTL